MDGYRQTQKLMVTPRSSRMCLTDEPRSKKVHGGLASRVRELLQARGCIKDQNAQQRRVECRLNMMWKTLAIMEAQNASGFHEDARMPRHSQ